MRTAQGYGLSIFSAAQTFPIPMDQHGNLTNWQRMFEVFEPNSDVPRKEAVNALSPHWFDKNKELISPELIIKTEQITDEDMDSESSSGTEASDDSSGSSSSESSETESDSSESTGDGDCLGS